jgi:phosphate starvation-inducible membrane PsiE
MRIFSVFKHGFSRVSNTKRMVFFAWFVNVVITLPLAFPVLSQLDGYLRNTVMDEKVLPRMDAAWADSYRADMENSEFVRAVDYTFFGYVPFASHLDMQMNGTFIKTLGNFLYDFFFRWEINRASTSLLFLLSLLYVCVNSFLSGAFIGVYSKEYPFSFTEFLTEGARYFGKFFRIALVALLVYFVFFNVVVDWVNNSIARWTQTEASETVPYAYYMIRNVIVLFFFSFLSMIFDYARIRMVVDDRTSSIAASAAGTKFAVMNHHPTYGLYLALCAIGFVLIALYAFIEKIIPQDSYWPLLFLFVLQQCYMFARFWLKAGFYACQTKLYQTISFERHLRNADASLSTPNQ